MSSTTTTTSSLTVNQLLTCITCRVGFHDLELQRDHYKSDWHRYNLKRKIANLPPITVEDFQEKVDAQQAQQEAQNTGKNITQYCTICKKSFGNEKAMQNHLTSNKHLQAVKEISASETKPEEKENNIASDQAVPNENGVPSNDVDMKSIETEKEKPKPKSEPEAIQVSETVSSNKKKGGKNFPPEPVISLIKPGKQMEVDSDEDEDGEVWEEIEGTPIPITTCLFCEKESKDYEKNLVHMSQEHSFFIPDAEYCIDVEGLLTYLGEKVGEGMMCLWCNEKGRQFYSVQAAQQHMRDKGHCRMLHEGDTVFEYSDFFDYSSSYPENFKGASADEPYQPQEIHFNDNMQLVLPSGALLGHRALKIYYKQYIRPGSQLVVRKSKTSKLLQQYKAIGYGETPLSLAQLKHKDQQYMRFVRDKYRMKLGMKGNSTLQTYFRRQVQF